MNNIPVFFWLVPIASVVALSMAWFFFRQMKPGPPFLAGPEAFPDMIGYGWLK